MDAIEFFGPIVIVALAIVLGIGFFFLFSYLTLISLDGLGLLAYDKTNLKWGALLIFNFVIVTALPINLTRKGD